MLRGELSWHIDERRSRAGSRAWVVDWMVTATRSAQGLRVGRVRAPSTRPRPSRCGTEIMERAAKIEFARPKPDVTHPARRAARGESIVAPGRSAQARGLRPVLGQPGLGDRRRRVRVLRGRDDRAHQVVTDRETAVPGLHHVQEGRAKAVALRGEELLGRTIKLDTPTRPKNALVMFARRREARRPPRAEEQAPGPWAPAFCTSAEEPDRGVLDAGVLGPREGLERGLKTSMAKFLFTHFRNSSSSPSRWRRRLCSALDLGARVASPRLPRPPLLAAPGWAGPSRPSSRRRGSALRLVVGGGGDARLGDDGGARQRRADDAALREPARRAARHADERVDDRGPVSRNATRRPAVALVGRDDRPGASANATAGVGETVSVLRLRPRTRYLARLAVLDAATAGASRAWARARRLGRAARPTAARALEPTSTPPTWQMVTFVYGRRSGCAAARPARPTAGRGGASATATLADESRRRPTCPRRARRRRRAGRVGRLGEPRQGRGDLLGARRDRRGGLRRLVLPPPDHGLGLPAGVGGLQPRRALGPAAAPQELGGRRRPRVELQLAAAGGHALRRAAPPARARLHGRGRQLQPAHARAAGRPLERRPLGARRHLGVRAPNTTLPGPWPHAAPRARRRAARLGRRARRRAAPPTATTAGGDGATAASPALLTLRRRARLEPARRARGLVVDVGRRGLQRRDRGWPRVRRLPPPLVGERRPRRQPHCLEPQPRRCLVVLGRRLRARVDALGQARMREPRDARLPRVRAAGRRVLGAALGAPAQRDVAARARRRQQPRGLQPRDGLRWLLLARGDVRPRLWRGARAPSRGSSRRRSRSRATPSSTRAPTGATR